jgi:hypothetical protein
MMMGHKDRSFHPLPRVSLEDLVPADHFYRHLEAKEWHGMRRFRLRRLKRVNAEPCWWRRDRTSRGSWEGAGGGGRGRWVLPVGSRHPYDGPGEWVTVAILLSRHKPRRSTLSTASGVLRSWLLSRYKSSKNT